MKIGDVVLCKWNGGESAALVIWVREREGGPPLVNLTMLSPHATDVGSVGRLHVSLENVPAEGSQDDQGKTLDTSRGYVYADHPLGQAPVTLGNVAAPGPVSGQSSDAAPPIVAPPPA